MPIMNREDNRMSEQNHPPVTSRQTSMVKNNQLGDSIKYKINCYFSPPNNLEQEFLFLICNPWAACDP